jgi:hypothetical protein
MTSPSLPVSVSLPLPGTTVTSAGSRSPPKMVTARPFVSPISSDLLAARCRGTSRRRARFGSVSRRDIELRLARDWPRGRPSRSCGHRGDLALEVPDAGLLGVAVDDLRISASSVQVDVEVLDAVRLGLLRASGTASRSRASPTRCSRELDDLHAVLQRQRDRRAASWRWSRTSRRTGRSRGRGSDR